MNFLNGRYGFDIFSSFLVILSAFLNLFPYVRYIAPFLLLIAVFRTFSRNISKRNAELYKFITLVNKPLGRFNKRLPYNMPTAKLESIPFAFKSLQYKFSQFRKFKIVTCPNCNQKLRLPRGKKRIVVTCKRCSHEFKIKT